MAGWMRSYYGACWAHGIKIENRGKWRDGVPLCFVLGPKLPAAGWHIVVNSANCQGCDAARCPPVFVVGSLFIADNNLAKGTGRCCWNHTAAVDEGDQ